MVEYESRSIFDDFPGIGLVNFSFLSANLVETLYSEQETLLPLWMRFFVVLALPDSNSVPVNKLELLFKNNSVPYNLTFLSF